MLICIDGLDGVGKSSVLKNASLKYDMPIIAKPINNLLCIDSEQSNIIKENLYSGYSSNVYALYYLLGYISALEDGKKDDYLLDRGFLSTYYFSCDYENKNLFDSIAKIYGFPDLTIVLYASIGERTKRIKRRDENDNDLRKQRIYSDDYRKIFEAIECYNVPYLIINTDNLTLDEVSQITDYIIQRVIIDKENNLRSLSELFNVNNLQLLGHQNCGEILNCIDELTTINQKKLIKENKYETNNKK